MKGKNTAPLFHAKARRLEGECPHEPHLVATLRRLHLIQTLRRQRNRLGVATKCIRPRVKTKCVFARCTNQSPVSQSTGRAERRSSAGKQTLVPPSASQARRQVLGGVQKWKPLCPLCLCVRSNWVAGSARVGLVLSKSGSKSIENK